MSFSPHIIPSTKELKESLEFSLNVYYQLDFMQHLFHSCGHTSGHYDVNCTYNPFRTASDGKDYFYKCFSQMGIHYVLH